MTHFICFSTSLTLEFISFSSSYIMYNHLLAFLGFKLLRRNHEILHLFPQTSLNLWEIITSSFREVRGNRVSITCTKEIATLELKWKVSRKASWPEISPQEYFTYKVGLSNKLHSVLRSAIPVVYSLACFNVLKRFSHNF